MKRCSICRKTKPLSEFYTGKYRCKKCHRAKVKACWHSLPLAVRQKRNLKSYKRAKTNGSAHKAHLKKRYGITPEHYAQLLETQNHRCAICERPETRNKLMGVDHCHSTGRVRGLLCDRCNIAIGLFTDDPRVLKKAIRYLVLSELV